MGTRSLSLTREIKIAASTATVFRCLTDPEIMVKWFGRKVDADVRVGGPVRVEINDTAAASGEFVEIVERQRVAFTFGWEGDASTVKPGQSTVEFEIIPDGSGTLVRLSHFDLPDDVVEAHTEGWNNYMPRLKSVGEGKDPGPDPFRTTQSK